MSDQLFKVVTEVRFKNPPKRVTIEEVDFIMRQVSEIPEDHSVMTCDPVAIEEIPL